MNNMLVSIIVASYNAQDYIEETLDSCINQTYKNIQIIVVDDGSTDGSINIITKWIADRKLTHPDILCNAVLNKENKGIPANFNTALKFVKGNWIKCIGSDDILRKDAVSTFIDKIQALDGHADLAAVFTYFKTFGHTVRNSQLFPLRWTISVCNMKPSWTKRKFAALHLNNLAPGAFINIKYFDRFDENYRLLEDLPLWLNFINNHYKTAFFNFISVEYRVHASQVTSSGNQLNKLLINDLKKLNRYRLQHGDFLAYFHHRYNLFCSSKNMPFFRYVKVLNPFNIIIQIYEKVLR